MSSVGVIDNAWLKYLDVVDNEAEKQFVTIVLPWLKKNGYGFIAGNGIWGVYSKDGDLYPETLPKHIRDILEMEIPGLRANDLGSLMPDYWLEHEKGDE